MIHHHQEETMTCSTPTLSQREDTPEGRPSPHHENDLTTESQWEEVLDDPSLRRLLREGHHTGGAHADLLTQWEENA